MKNSDIYKIAYNLGMIEDDTDSTTNDYDKNFEGCVAISADASVDTRGDAKRFEQDVATDLVKTMNFVDELCLYNDLDTIKKFLVAVIYQNK